jgi:hypothetical protein
LVRGLDGVGVQVQRDRDGAVAQVSARGLGIHPTGQHQRRRRVPEAVGADRRCRPARPSAALKKRVTLRLSSGVPTVLVKTTPCSAHPSPSLRHSKS